MSAPHRPQKQRPFRGGIAGDGGVKRDRAVWFEVDAVGRAMLGERQRLGIESDIGATYHPIPPGIYVRRADRSLFGAAPPALGPDEAAHFEEVGKVACEGKRKQQLNGLCAIIVQSQALMKRLARDEKRSGDVQQILLQHDDVAVAEIRIGEVDLKNTIVVRQRRSEQERRNAVDQKLKPGKITRIVVKQ